MEPPAHAHSRVEMLAVRGVIKKSTECARKIVRRPRPVDSFREHNKKSGDIGAIRGFACQDRDFNGPSAAQMTVPTVYFREVSNDIRRMRAGAGISALLASLVSGGITLPGRPAAFVLGPETRRYDGFRGERRHDLDLQKARHQETTP